MFEQVFKNIDDILHKDAGCTSELDYTEQSSWLLFLKYLDALEADKASEAALEGKPYRAIIEPAYRWETWAAPKGPDGKLDHNAALTGDDKMENASLCVRLGIAGRYAAQATAVTNKTLDVGLIRVADPCHPAGYVPHRASFS